MLASIRSVSLLKCGCPYVYSVKYMVAEDVCKMLHNMNYLGNKADNITDIQNTVQSAISINSCMPNSLKLIRN